MPHLIQRYREQRTDHNDEVSRSPLMSLAETAGKKEQGDQTPSAPSSSTRGSSNVTSSSLVTPSNTPENNPSNKRCADETNENSNGSPNAAATSPTAGNSSGNGDSDDDGKPDTTGAIPVPSSNAPSSSTKLPAANNSHTPTSGPAAPWYSPNMAQTSYHYPPHPHMAMNMNMYHPPYHPAYPWNPGMYYPHSPYPHHPGAPSPHAPHMYPPAYGYHNPGAVMPPTPNQSQSQGDENASLNTSNTTTSAGDCNKSSNNTVIQETDENKQPDAKRIKTEHQGASTTIAASTTAAQSESNSQTTASFTTPHHPQTPRSMMPPNAPPPHYYQYYPPHHPHPHTPLNAHSHVPPHYYNSHQENEGSKRGENLSRCERISVPKGTQNITPKPMKKTSSSSPDGSASPSDPQTSEFTMPSFQSLVNFPSSIHRRMKSASELRCVMCGEIRSSTHTKKEVDAHGTPAANQHHIIPKQNKGLCTACDVAVWLIKEEQVEIKWCKGCKNFKPWADFGEKPCATKCGKCREKQREKYAQKVGRECPTSNTKKEKGSDDEDTMPMKGSDNGLSYLIAATNQVSNI